MSQLPIPLPLNESRWRYVTASGGGVTVAFLAGSGGSITLLSPEGENVSFRYGGVGGGIGLGMRLPRFGKVNLNVKGKSVGGAGALEALPSTGTVLVADGLVGRDLSRGDFTGPCMYVELGAGVIAGGSGTAILFGLDPKLLAAVNGERLAIDRRAGRRHVAAIAAIVPWRPVDGRGQRRCTVRRRRGGLPGGVVLMQEGDPGGSPFLPCAGVRRSGLR